MTFSVFSCLLRITLIGTVVPGLVATTILTSSSLLFTGRPLNWTMTSPGSMPAFAAAPPAGTCATSAPRALLQAEVLERLARNRQHRHADAARA